MLREMAREPDQFRNEPEQRADLAASRVETGFADALGLDGGAVPPMQRFGERPDLQVVESERLADVAYCAFRPIGNHGRGERGTVARVSFVNILDDFLSALVLEIHVDIGRLVTFLGDEPFHEHLHPRGIDLGYPEAEANRGVRRRSSALAENAAVTRKSDDVVNGQEIRLVPKLGDELKLVLY